MKSAGLHAVLFKLLGVVLLWSRPFELMEECSIRGCGQYHRREDIASQATNRLRGRSNLVKRDGTNFVAVDEGYNFGTVINQ